MNRDKVEPGVMAYRMLVTGLCQTNRVQKAYDFFKEMKKKKHLIDRSIYRSLIQAFVKDGNVSVGIDLLQDLMKSGYKADLAIYNHLINGFCITKQVDKAFKLFRVTVQEDLQPDFSTVNPLLTTYAELGRMDDFCRLLNEMQRLGFCVINELSKFFSLIVENPEKLDTALKVFEKMKAKNNVSVSIHDTLMAALHRNRDSIKALSLYHDLQNLLTGPDSLSCSIAIQCYIEIGDIPEACNCYNKIIDMSLLPSIPAYQSLVYGLFTKGEFDAAMMLICECLANLENGPLSFKCVLTVIHACRSNDMEKVMEAISEMDSEGFDGNFVFYAVIYGFRKHGTMEEGRKVFEGLRKAGYISENDVYVYDELLIEYMKKKTAYFVLCGLKVFGLEKKLKNKGSTLLPR